MDQKSINNRMFNLVRKQNFGSKSHSGSDFFVFFSKCWVIKKNHENFKILFWSRESKKTMFTIFLFFFLPKQGNLGISSETTIPGISSETTSGSQGGFRPSGQIKYRALRSFPGPSSPSRLPESSSHSRFPYSRFLFVKNLFFIVEKIVDRRKK